MARFRLFLAPAALALLIGCESAGTPASPGAEGTFVCADGTTLVTRLEADQDVLSVVIPERAQLRLPRVDSPSGARFSNGNLTFWDRGEQAQWIVGDRPPVPCQPAT